MIPDTLETSMLFRWLHHQVSRQQASPVALPSALPTDLVMQPPATPREPARPRQMLVLDLALPASRRFIIGTEDGRAFLGCQRFDLLPLLEVRWTDAILAMQPNNAARLYLCAAPLSLKAAPEKADPRSGIAISVMVMTKVMQALGTGITQAATLELRRINMEGGVVTGIARRAAAEPMRLRVVRIRPPSA